MKAFLISLSIVIFLFLAGCGNPYMRASCDTIDKTYRSSQDYFSHQFDPPKKVSPARKLVAGTLYFSLCTIYPTDCLGEYLGRKLPPVGKSMEELVEEDYINNRDAAIKKNCPIKDEVLRKMQELEDYPKIDSK